MKKCWVLFKRFRLFRPLKIKDILSGGSDSFEVCFYTDFVLASGLLRRVGTRTLM